MSVSNSRAAWDLCQSGIEIIRFHLNESTVLILRHPLNSKNYTFLSEIIKVPHFYNHLYPLLGLLHFAEEMNKHAEHFDGKLFR